MKPKARTIIEKFGFADDDKKDSTHDQIQLWVFKNFSLVVNSCYRSHYSHDSTPELEHPITENKFIVGFVDLYKDGFAIEVKSKIPSIGELIRQINFYRNYTGGRWIVVSPDDRYADVLRAQDIQFYKCKAPGELF